MCGSGESARPLKEANAAFEAQAKQSDICQFERADFEALLDWAVDYAQRVHRIRAPWLPVADADDEPMDGRGRGWTLSGSTRRRQRRGQWGGGHGYGHVDVHGG